MPPFKYPNTLLAIETVVCTNNKKAQISQFTFLAASPDGFMSCRCCGGDVLEIKCPFYPRDAMLARVIEIATCLSVRHAPVLCQNEES